MIRLLFLLCAGLYLTLMILGEDRGQKRYGLMMADSMPKAEPQPEAAPEAVVFIPAQPAKPPVVAAPVPVVAAAAPAAPQPETGPANPIDTAALPAPQMSDGLLYTVAANQANVRGGPGRNFAVMDSLQKGEQVLVVFEEQPVEGWARIRLEGDGVEGYIATRLLTRIE